MFVRLQLRKSGGLYHIAREEDFTHPLVRPHHPTLTVTPFGDDDCRITLRPLPHRSCPLPKPPLGLAVFSQTWARVSVGLLA